MNLDNFTEQATYCLQKAHNFASSLAHQRLLPEHLLSQLLKEPNGLPSRIIELAKGDRNKLEILLANYLDTVPGKNSTLDSMAGFFLDNNSYMNIGKFDFDNIK